MQGEEPRQQRGVHNARVIDLITSDSESGEVVLVMLEERPWGSDPLQLRQLEEKFNSYLGYVLDGHMAKQYPQYEKLRVRFQLDCAAPPRAEEQPFLTAVRNFAASEKIRFVVNVIEG